MVKSALLSAFNKSGLEDLIDYLNEQGVRLYASGGTADYIRSLDCMVEDLSDVTGFPSILGGRVKTLHPSIFGGILAVRQSNEHMDDLQKHGIDTFDLVLVDLYPFEETLNKTNDHQQIIEKIDIGGVALLRAAAKNYEHVIVIPCASYYQPLIALLKAQNCSITLEQRRFFAWQTFQVTSQYEQSIAQYFAKVNEGNFPPSGFNVANRAPILPLRYGENPHQKGYFEGNLESLFEKLSGKELSYNNLLDLDSGERLLAEFINPAFVIIKHNNSSGVAERHSIFEAWEAAFDGDPISAFGGVLLCNKEIDEQTAERISRIFFEVVIAPDYSLKALEILKEKPNRIILRRKNAQLLTEQLRTALNGKLLQSYDNVITDVSQFSIVTDKKPNEQEIEDMVFGEKIAKHLKSNAIAIVKNKQLIGSGIGQTNRIDATKQAIEKAKHFGFELKGAVLASDAFFPFPDVVQYAHQNGVECFIQPGGSIKDTDSIQYCIENNLCMVFTGVRHFKH